MFKFSLDDMMTSGSKLLVVKVQGSDLCNAPSPAFSKFMVPDFSQPD